MAALFLGLAIFAAGAKCIENDRLYQDESGDWHVVGEIHNETDVWGVEMLLGGQLLDANGGVIATARAPICPFELAPGSFNAFDVHFDNSSNLEPAGYKLNVVEGRALDHALPDSGLALDDFAAEETQNGIHITGTVSSTRTYDGILTGCAAVYNADGRVNSHFTLVNFGLTLPLEAGEPQPVGFILPEFLVEPGAISVRLWLAGDSDDPLESDYKAVMTGPIDID